MGESLSLRITAIFATLLASAFGIGIPLYYKKHDDEDTPLFKCMKAAAAGVMLGLALCHLIAEANEELLEVVPDYNLCYAVTAGGVLLVVVVEQLAMIYSSEQAKAARQAETSAANDDKSTELQAHAHSHAHDHAHNNTGTPVDDDAVASNIELANTANPEGIRLRTNSSDNNSHCLKHNHSHAHDHGHAHNHGSNVHGSTTGSTGECLDERHKTCMHNHQHGAEDMFKNLLQTDSIRDMVSVYAMEVSVAVHSIIIGVEIGLLAGSENVITLVSLTVAICFHQFMEGFSLGTNLCNVMGGYQAAEGVLGNFKLLLFVLIFIITVPLGIVIGILTASSSSAEADGSVLAKGCASSLAAGSLLYISLAEMMAVYFNAPELVDQPRLKIAMLFSLCVGAAAMAVLAAWA